MVRIPSKPLVPKHIPVVTPCVEQVRRATMRTVARPADVPVSWTAFDPELGSGAGWVPVIRTGPLVVKSTAVSQPAPIVTTSTAPTASLACAFCCWGRRVRAQSSASCGPGGIGPSRGGAHGGSAGRAMLDVGAREPPVPDAATEDSRPGRCWPVHPPTTTISPTSAKTRVLTHSGRVGGLATLRTSQVCAPEQRSVIAGDLRTHGGISVRSDWPIRREPR
jgi:hypothetical protein